MNTTALHHLRARDAAPLFVTGAGISVASGLPTFRGSDPDAIWSNGVLDKGTLDYFRRFPERSWAWYLSRFDGLRGAQPNAAHLAVAEIERKRPLTMLITQNIDELHQRAGSGQHVEIHGSAYKMRCTNRYCEYGHPRGFMPWDEGVLKAFRANPSRKTVPRCSNCGKFLRPHVLWFDESYTSHHDYQFNTAMNWLHEATMIVFIGTSLAVGITEMVIEHGRQTNTPMWIIDPHMSESPSPVLKLIQRAAEDVLPEWAEAM
ncbi:MAG: SIR2 family NAD-dependent protein deacylase [Bradymonadia bacterium]